MKIKEALNLANEKLKGISDIDGKLILFKLFDMDDASLFLNQDKEMSLEDYDKYFSYVLKRKNHIPYQELFHEAIFYGEKFKINKDVLTPRKETEILVENCIYIIGREKINDILDLCTGSGIIGITIKKRFPTINIYMSDVSKKALDIAKENAKLNNVDVNILESDLFNNINRRFDMIVSNPPYINRKEIENLDIEVKDYDPLIALDGGIDGLDFYRKIIKEGKEYLNDNGVLAFEIGYDEGEDVRNLLEMYGYQDIKIIKDYSDFDRILIARKNTGL